MLQVNCRQRFPITVQPIRAKPSIENKVLLKRGEERRRNGNLIETQQKSNFAISDTLHK